MKCSGGVIGLCLLAAQIFSSAPAQADKLRALYGDGSVRYAAVGPVSLNADQNALIGLLVPAVRKAHATIRIVDNRGMVLKTSEIDIPTDQIPTDQKTAGFWGISLKVSVVGGNIALDDGTTQEVIGSITNSQNISVLIGLLLPAVQKVREAASRMHAGSLQIMDVRSGNVVSSMSIDEQAVNARTLNFTR